MRVIITKNYQEMSKLGAQIIARQLTRKPKAVLGLATGGTPEGTYQELIRMHQKENLDFSKVTTFNLDEYVGLEPEHPQSYYYFMCDKLFNHVNINKERVYVPAGICENFEAYCQWYEQEIMKAGGIDLQLLGIGSDGHIAFNEPGSSLGSRTRVVTLHPQTRRDNARFFDREADVPYFAVTMGVGTILEVKELLLLANGEKKAEPVAAFIEGPVTSQITASALQLHPKATVILDEGAASKLKNIEMYKFAWENRHRIKDFTKQFDL